MDKYWDEKLKKKTFIWVISRVSAIWILAAFEVVEMWPGAGL